MKINPVALTNVALAGLGIMYAVNKKPPEWLVLSSLLIGVVSVVKESQAIFIDESPPVLPPNISPNKPPTLL